MKDKQFYTDLATKNIEGIMRRALKGLGNSTAIYLDSGAIIHFENLIRTLRRASANKFGSSDFYNIASRFCPRLYVTTPVMDEVDKHCKHHSINGCQEISNETNDLVISMHKSMISGIRMLNHQKPYSEIGHDVYWAGMIAFPKNHKKNGYDPISRTDRDLITACVDTRYTEGTTGVAVLTTDEHITKTIDVLVGNNSTAVDNYSLMIEPASSRVIGEVDSILPFISEGPLFNYSQVNAINLLEGRK